MSKEENMYIGAALKKAGGSILILMLDFQNYK